MTLRLAVSSVIILVVASSKKSPPHGRKQLLIVVVLVLMAAALLPQLDSFGDSLHLLRNLNSVKGLMAAILIMLTYFLAAATYCFLAFVRLPYRQTVLAQYAAMFINRLLPSGVGALGINYAYLHKMRHTPAQAAAILGVNNLSGLLGHSLLFVVVLLFFNVDTPPLHLPMVASADIWIAGATVLIACLILLMMSKLRGKLQHGFGDILQQLSGYRHRPAHVLGALSSSTALTLCNMASLAVCLQAVGGNLSFAAIVIIFTIGIGAGTATPTPGGLGGIEAGLLAGFLAYGIPQATALAAVILYRILSYWLTLLIGSLAFFYCQRHHYFSLG